VGHAAGTGAARGFSRELTEQLLARGHPVAATSVPGTGYMIVFEALSRHVG